MADNVKKFKTFDGVEHDLEDTQARADIADIAANTYTKTEIDSRLTGYAEKTDVYDKTETYSKTEVDDALVLKANVADVYAKTETYDKTEVDSALTLKANVVDVYSKTETDTMLGAKANSADVYTKTEADNLLGAKANSADVYTITQSDALLDTKCGIDDTSITATVMTWSASKLNVDFSGKADSTDVYSKTEVYTKAEVDALIGGLKMFPLLDFSNPIDSFTTNTELNYTVPEDCWMLVTTADAASTGFGKVIINGLALTVSKGGDGGGCCPPLLRVKQGDVITTTGYPQAYGGIYFLRERS